MSSAVVGKMHHKNTHKPLFHGYQESRPCLLLQEIKPVNITSHHTHVMFIPLSLSLSLSASLSPFLSFSPCKLFSLVFKASACIFHHVCGTAGGEKCKDITNDHVHAWRAGHFMATQRVWLDIPFMHLKQMREGDRAVLFVPPSLPLHSALTQVYICMTVW